MFIVGPFLFGSFLLEWSASTEVPELYSSAFDMISSFLSVDKVSFITVLFLLSLIGNQSAESLASLQSKRDQMSSKDLAVMIERNAGVTTIAASNAPSIVFKTSIILMLSFWVMRSFYDINADKALETCALFAAFDVGLFFIQKHLISTTLQDREEFKKNELIKEFEKIIKRDYLMKKGLMRP